MRLGCAMIFVNDLSGMAEFYGQTMGLKLIPETRSDVWMEFEAGNARLALHLIPSDIAPCVDISSPVAVREENPTKLRFAVDDVNVERARLEGLGVRIIHQCPEYCDGVDPEGNVSQIYKMD